MIFRRRKAQPQPKPEPKPVPIVDDKEVIDVATLATFLLAGRLAHPDEVNHINVCHPEKYVTTARKILEETRKQLSTLP